MTPGLTKPRTRRSLKFGGGREVLNTDVTCRAQRRVERLIPEDEAHAFVRNVGKACKLSGAAAPAEVPQLTANFTDSAFQIVAGRRARRALVGAGVVRGLIADDVLARVARVAGRVRAVALVERVVLAHGAVRGR